MASEAVIPVQEFSGPECDPPRLLWWQLFLIAAAVGIASAFYGPRALRGVAGVFVYDGWAIYLCLWMRRLNPAARSFYWALPCPFLDLGAVAVALLAGNVDSGSVLMIPISVLKACAGILMIVSAFKLRGELQWHYNVVENRGLVLDGVMTFFFTYLYIQYHLADIAEQRIRERGNFRRGITG